MMEFLAGNIKKKTEQKLKFLFINFINTSNQNYNITQYTTK